VSERSEPTAADLWLEVSSRPPTPVADAMTQFFWDGVARNQLMIQRCNACGMLIHEPLPFCRFCLSTDLGAAEVSGRAVLDTFTIVMQPYQPYFVGKVPYNLSVVELEEQKHLKMVTNVVDCDNDDLKVGMPLVVTFREAVPGMTLPYFRPA
jgi:uncharacterized OB-fold protein